MFSLVAGLSAVWAQTVVFQETFQNYQTASAPPPAGWTVLNVDGLTTTSDLTGDGLITTGTWEQWRLQLSQTLTRAGVWTSSVFEPAGGTANDWLISPPINLTNSANPLMRFNAFGPGNNVLEVRYATSIAGTNPAPSDFTNLLGTVSGSGNLTNVALREIDLAAVANTNNVRLAFRYIGSGGILFGINDMTVINFEDNDLSLDRVSAVGAQRFTTDYLQADFSYEVYPCSPSANSQIQIGFTNSGVNPVTSFTASYVVDEEPPVVETVTLSTPLAFGESATYTFATTADLTNDPLYGLVAFVEMTNDASTANDTAETFFVITPETYDFDTDGPFTSNFDLINFGVGFGDFQTAWGWTFQDANNDGFSVRIRPQNAPGTFGATAFSGDFMLLYTWNQASAANDWAFSPCLDLQTGVGYQVKVQAKCGEDVVNGVPTIFPERFRFGYGTAANAASMTPLGQFDVNSTSYSQFASSFTVPTAGTYHVGVNVNSTADQFFLALDDLEITTFTAAPTAAFGVTNFDRLDGNVYVDYCDSTVTITNTTAGVADQITVNWGDGSPAETFSGFTLSHKYNSLNTFTITVTASNALGNSSATAQVQITNQPASVADFTTVVSGGTVTIVDASTPVFGQRCATSTYTWSFGDGSPNVVHGGNAPAPTSRTYTTCGTFTIALIIETPGSAPSVKQVEVVIPESACLSINEISFANAVSVYPNPTTEVVNVAFELNSAQDVELSVIAIDGKTVDTKKIENALNVNSSFNVSNLNNGVYFIRIKTEEGISTQRFVVSKK